MQKATDLDKLVDFLVDAGMEEETVQHFLTTQKFNGKTIMEYIREDDWLMAWAFAQAYMAGL